MKVSTSWSIWEVGKWCGNTERSTRQMRKTDKESSSYLSQVMLCNYWCVQCSSYLSKSLVHNVLNIICVISLKLQWVTNSKMSLLILTAAWRTQPPDLNVNNETKGWNGGFVIGHHAVLTWTESRVFSLKQKHYYTSTASRKDWGGFNKAIWSKFQAWSMYIRSQALPDSKADSEADSAWANTVIRELVDSLCRDGADAQ